MAEEKYNEQNLHKEIDLIQGCINRMAHNSFLVKGWAISLLSIVLVLTSENSNSIFISFFMFLSVLCFWYLDGFFLYTGKMYRKMYKWVITNRPLGNKDLMYDLTPQRFKSEKKFPILCVMFSKTLLPFYLLLVLGIIGFVILQLGGLNELINTNCSRN